MAAEDDLNNKDQRDFWRMLRDPIYAELLDHYTENKKVFAKEDERITQDITDLMADLNKKLGKIDD